MIRYNRLFRAILAVNQNAEKRQVGTGTYSILLLTAADITKMLSRRLFTKVCWNTHHILILNRSIATILNRSTASN